MFSKTQLGGRKSRIDSQMVILSQDRVFKMGRNGHVSIFIRLR